MTYGEQQVIIDNHQKQALTRYVLNITLIPPTALLRGGHASADSYRASIARNIVGRVSLKMLRGFVTFVF